MGCDIHLHIEVKVNENWLHYSVGHCARNYKIFGKLANVRELNEEHFRVKGLPSDISTITKIAYNEIGVDAHTVSFITKEEIIKLSEWMHKNTPFTSNDENDDAIHVYLNNDLEFGWLKQYLFGNNFSLFWEYPNDYPKEIQDVRFVFWFDN